jgi:pimeloyl-ACP methyl ester carboxylesterase
MPGRDERRGRGGPVARPPMTTKLARRATATVWQGRVRLGLQVDGDGPAVVFFDGPWGLTWDAFLDALARRFTVYAPEHPGTTPGEPDTIQAIDTLWDLALCYDEMLDELGLSDVAFVGHSFGAMVACEVAALRPSRARRLVLLDPIGLWRDDAPVTNWMLVGLPELPELVFRDAGSPAAQSLFAIPDDPEAGALARTRLMWAMGATGKFIWPIPDKGLVKRIHRLRGIDSLLVWGADDRVVPRVYAEEFARRLAHTRTEIVEAAGHAPHLEQPAATARVVEAFLEG